MFQSLRINWMYYSLVQKKTSISKKLYSSTGHGSLDFFSLMLTLGRLPVRTRKKNQIFPRCVGPKKKSKLAMPHLSPNSALVRRAAVRPAHSTVLPPSPVARQSHSTTHSGELPTPSPMAPPSPAAPPTPVAPMSCSVLPPCLDRAAKRGGVAGQA